ncbi:hypothetical protein JW824_03600 [bacterium]|nr:hypothetical protein [bacterium]
MRLKQIIFNMDHYSRQPIIKNLNQKMKSSSMFIISKKNTLNRLPILLHIWAMVSLIEIDLCHSQYVHHLGSFNGRLEIKCDRKEYYLYEPVKLNIQFENQSSDTVYFHLIKIREYINIVDSKGKNYRYAMIVDPIDPQGDPFPPGFGFDIDAELDIFLYGIGKESGKYSISYTMHDIGSYWDENSGIFYVYDSLISNTIEIVYIEPIGDDLRAFNLYKEGCQSTINKNWDLALYEFKMILRYLPSSLYASYAEEYIDAIYRRLEK